MIKMPAILTALGTTLLLSSCADDVFHDAYDIRNKAAADVGLEEATPTVWNEDTPLELGRIYHLFGNQHDGFSLTSYSGLFVKSIGESTVSNIGPDHSSWSSTISDQSQVNLQLGYMGLNALVGTNSVKKISFSLDSDVKGQVTEFDALQKILNDPDNGPTLRASILDDTKTVFGRKEDRRNAKFWIVLGVHTAKNLTVILHSDTSLNGKLDTSDASELASWIKVPSLVFPTLDGQTEQTQDATFKAPDSFGWVAMCVPLFAYTSGPLKGQIYPDQTTVLWAANSLHH